jgi:filamentous hemagglutinin
MNKSRYRLVYSKPRGMLVAVEETATGTGKATENKVDSESGKALRASHTWRLSLSCISLATLVFAATAAGHAYAQVVADPNGGAHKPTVIQTANGIQQVNITAPSGAGVSQNAYSQFDVPKAGVILNNSSTIVNTQQAGYVNGNPNLAAGQSARIILNQVNSNSPSQLRGYIEVAGSKAEVVVANGSGTGAGRRAQARNDRPHTNCY